MGMGDRLARSHHYWLAAVWPEGKPHVTPIWGIWRDNNIWFSCSRWLEKAKARERVPDVLAEPDPVRRLAGAASWLIELYAADFDVVMILGAATDESPETRELLRAKLADRNEVMDAMIASLDGPMAVPVPEAQAVYRALAASGVYRELVYESGWTPQHFEPWLADALNRHLFGTSPATKRKPSQGPHQDTAGIRP